MDGKTNAVVGGTLAKFLKPVPGISLTNSTSANFNHKKYSLIYANDSYRSQLFSNSILCREYSNNIAMSNVLDLSSIGTTVPTVNITQGNVETIINESGILNALQPNNQYRIFLGFIFDGQDHGAQHLDHYNATITLDDSKNPTIKMNKSVLYRYADSGYNNSTFYIGGITQL